MALNKQNVALDAGPNGAFRASEYQNASGVVVSPLSSAAAIPDLAGALTGATDGTIVDVAAIALSTSDTYTDAAVNTAVNTAITSVNLQLKELQDKVNDILAAARETGVIEV
jgi:hypothetical protein